MALQASGPMWPLSGSGRNWEQEVYILSHVRCLAPKRPGVGSFGIWKRHRCQNRYTIQRRQESVQQLLISARMIHRKGGRGQWFYDNLAQCN